jgi:hypothetical protein
MHTDFPTLNSLFAQLGLPSSADEIETFINQHAPLPAAVHLAEAPFWAHKLFNVEQLVCPKWGFRQMHRRRQGSMLIDKSLNFIGR